MLCFLVIFLFVNHLISQMRNFFFVNWVVCLFYLCFCFCFDYARFFLSIYFIKNCFLELTICMNIPFNFLFLRVNLHFLRFSFCFVLFNFALIFLTVIYFPLDYLHVIGNFRFAHWLTEATLSWTRISRNLQSCTFESNW